MRKLKITELNRLTVDEFKKADKLPLAVVLDEVRSLHNIGGSVSHIGCIFGRLHLFMWYYSHSSPSRNA